MAIIKPRIKEAPKRRSWEEPESNDDEDDELTESQQGRLSFSCSE